MKKIIVAHPEKQHSYYMAEVANEAGILKRYVTTVYCKKGSFTKFLDGITGHKLHLNVIRRMASIDDRKIQQFCELRGLFLLILRRTYQNKVISRFQNYHFDVFGKKVASYAQKNNVNAVVMYDTSSLACFKELEGTNIVRIMDTSIANRAYTKSIYENIIDSFEEWENFSEKDILLNKYEMKRLLDEIELTDYFIVPSQFVKKSLVFSGVPGEKIYIVPYGVDTELFCFSERRNNINEGPLKLLFVGECTYRKGINYLLEAAQNCSDYVELTVVGGYQKILSLYKKYKGCKNIHFVGRIPHAQLTKIYQSADIFVLPSLSEGMSRVGLEAMACGIPLLCSANCGVNDLIEEDRNGWVLPEISSCAIEEKIKVILKKRKEIIQMGQEARITAESYNWDTYKKNMKRTLNEILGG